MKMIIVIVAVRCVQILYIFAYIWYAASFFFFFFFLVFCLEKLKATFM